MKITVDTNVLVRAVMRDDERQARTAAKLLKEAELIAVNRPAADAGLAVLNEGGDFADGLIAYEGNWLGGETFVSFDKKAVSLIVKQGQQAKLLT